MWNEPPAAADRATAVFSISRCAVALLALASVSATVETYGKAEVDPGGQLRIVTTDGREILPPKDKEQVGFEKPAISGDRRAVGWLAVYPNCCTSYPIPLKLVVYANGKARAFTGVGLPIWQWRFVAGGKQVAYQQETVHGGLGVHFELRDVASGRLIAAHNPGEPGAPPKWVNDLESR